MVRLLGLLMLFAVMAGGAMAATPQVQTVQFKEQRKHYLLEVAYPRFGHAAIDRQIEAWARQMARDFVESAKDAVGDPNPWGMELSYDVQRNDNVMAVVVFTYYLNTGGAHPNSSFQTFNFFKSDGQQVEFAELFTGKGIRRISDISIARLKRDLTGPDSMSDLDWIKKGAGPNARNFSAFAMLPRQLAIYFDPYQVAAYAAGPQEVRIPLSQLGDVMRVDPRAPAASFECRDARSDVEQAICGSRDLARLDRQLGEAYQNKLTWAADVREAQRLREQQRAWLRMRDGACRAASMPMVACLSPIYQKRLKELEGPAE